MGAHEGREGGFFLLIMNKNVLLSKTISTTKKIKMFVISRMQRFKEL